MARSKKSFKRPIGKAQKTGETEAWPWERKSEFCQSTSHSWHVCLDHKYKNRDSYHVLFAFSDKNTAINKARSLNKVYKKSGHSLAYVRNWITNKSITLD